MGWKGTNHCNEKKKEKKRKKKEKEKIIMNQIKLLEMEMLT